MNYLGHGYKFLDDPYFLAGTALPDWLNVVHRKIRVREKTAHAWINNDDETIVRFARGVMQHHQDDGWFHQQPAFVELNQLFLSDIRSYLPDANGMVVWFLAHILVEILIDATLDENNPGLLDEYYESIANIDPAWVGQLVNQMTGRDAEHLPWMIERFNEVRFLEDYRADDRLLFRLNQVMSRVALEPLPDILTQYFPQARTLVAEKLTLLIEPPVFVADGLVESSDQDRSSDQKTASNR